MLATLCHPHSTAWWHWDSLAGNCQLLCSLGWDLCTGSFGQAQHPQPQALGWHQHPKTQGQEGLEAASCWKATLPWLSGGLHKAAWHRMGMQSVTGSVQPGGQQGTEADTPHKDQAQPNANRVNVLAGGQGWQQRGCLNHIMPI